MNPTLSVIVPCYNHGRYLKRSIESVLNQSAEAVEIIVVDDGSTDNSSAVAHAFGARIQFRQQTNAGPAAARNTGLEHAHGRYVTFLDADDQWLPGFVSEMMTRLEHADERIAVLGCGWRYIQSDDTPIGPPHHVDSTRLGWDDLILANSITMSAALARTETIRRVGGFDGKVVGVEDWELWLRVLNAGYRLSAIGDCLIGYRVLPDSVSRNVSLMFKNSLYVLDKAFAQLSPPQSAVKRRDKAYAWRYLDACVGMYAQKEIQKAEAYFIQGVRIWPDLLRDQHSLYTLVCAEQPIYHKASRFDLDLRQAEERTRGLLQRFYDEHPIQVRAALGELYTVLARLARIQQQKQLARRYALEAARISPKEQLVNSLKTLGKTWLSLAT